MSFRDSIKKVNNLFWVILAYAVVISLKFYYPDVQLYGILLAILIGLTYFIFLPLWVYRTAKEIGSKNPVLLSVLSYFFSVGIFVYLANKKSLIKKHQKKEMKLKARMSSDD